MLPASTDDANALMLNNENGDGLAVLKNISFDTGQIELELNTTGRSFIYLSINIQNDSTYEAIYFRPFNFQAEALSKRAHAVQYISHPKHSWRYLRTNHEGQYEAEYPWQPFPEQWFGVSVRIDRNTVTVYDIQSKANLLSVTRIATPLSDKVGL